MNKYFIATTTAAILSASSAFSADAIIYTDVSPIAPVSAYDWSGAYLGLNFGYAGGKAKHPYGITFQAESLGGSLDMNSSGFFGGVQAGWNFQSDQMVYGLEADFQGANIEGTTRVSLNEGASSLNGEAGTKLNWFGTVRARLGYTVTDRFLAYATGGLAYGSTKSFMNGQMTCAANGQVICTGSFDESVKKTKAGWTVGAGVEYAVTNNWSVKTEYLYTDLGKANVFSFNDLGMNATIDRKFNFHTARIGFNYKF